MKYRIENKAASTADVYLYDEIGYWGVSAQAFANELQEITAGQINLHVNSYGGEVFDGVAMYNALRKHSATVTVYIDGVAASAASFIAMAGDKVVMARNATIMIHDALTVAIGNAADLRREADLLDKISENIADIYAQKAGGPVSGWRGKMQEETWYSAAEALTAGLVDEVTDADSEDEDPLENIAAEFDRMIMARAGGRPRRRERIVPVAVAASTSRPLASTTPEPGPSPDGEVDTDPGNNPANNPEDTEVEPENSADNNPCNNGNNPRNNSDNRQAVESEQEPEPAAPESTPQPAEPDPDPVPEPRPEAVFDPDAFRAGLADAIPRDKPWDPDQFRLAMQAVALDAPAPRDLPAPVREPVPVAVVVPDPAPPVEDGPLFDSDLFKAAIGLVVTDTPAPPDRSRDQKPAPEPDFSLIARAIREARL